MISCISLGYLCLGICAHTTFIQSLVALILGGGCMQRHLVALILGAVLGAVAVALVTCTMHQFPRNVTLQLLRRWWQLLSYQSGKTAACLLVKYTSA